MTDWSILVSYFFIQHTLARTITTVTDLFIEALIEIQTAGNLFIIFFKHDFFLGILLHN